MLAHLDIYCNSYVIMYYVVILSINRTADTDKRKASTVPCVSFLWFMESVRKINIIRMGVCFFRCFKPCKDAPTNHPTPWGKAISRISGR